MNSFFNIAARKTLHVKFTVSDFYFFYDPRKKRKEERKKKKKIWKQGNRTISFDDTIDTLSLFPRPTQNLEDIFLTRINSPL